MLTPHLPNEPLTKKLPYIFYTLPLELLIFDEKFTLSGALQDMNQVRYGDKLTAKMTPSYLGTFNLMGQIGVGTHWGVRSVETPNLWNYLKDTFSLKDGDFFNITNALPTFAHSEELVSLSKALVLKKRALKEEKLNGTNAN